jgi:hypothetical protein
MDELITTLCIRGKRQIGLDHKACDPGSQLKSKFDAAIHRTVRKILAVNGHEKMFVHRV